MQPIRSSTGSGTASDRLYKLLFVTRGDAKEPPTYNMFKSLMRALGMGNPLPVIRFSYHRVEFQIQLA
jgi:hypothetical protein